MGRAHVHFFALVLRRFLFRSLALAGILLACFAHLVWNGWHAKQVVAENLPHPPLSSGKRDIDLWHPTASFGHVYDLTFAWPEEKPWSVPDGSRLQAQLASNGRTRLLVVRNGHPNDSVSWWDILRGRERLQIVADREWVDLGPFPASGTQLDVQIYGLLPGPFGFAEQNQPGTAHFSGFRIRRPDSPLARPSRTIVRYRFLLGQPVPPAETLARFFFFISCSRVLQVTGVVAIVLLFAGWWWLFEKRYARAVACLVPAVTLIHACCLAPFQGADETPHAGTVETVIWNPGAFARPTTYPKSLALLYDSIGYERWVRYSDVPVSIDSLERRERVRDVASRRLDAEAMQEGINLIPDAFLLDPRTRAPLYYNGLRLLGPVLRRLSVLDRLEAYVVLSATASLLLFCGGLLILTRSGLGPSVLLLYGLVALLPYSVGVVASCSNYSLAIGLGALLAACSVAAILTENPRFRAQAILGFTAASTAGIGIWDDFVFLAGPAFILLVAIGIAMAWRLPPGRARVLWTGFVAGAGSVSIVLVGWSLVTGRLRALFSNFGARLPKQLGGPEDPTFWVLLGTAAIPLAFALVLVLFLVRGQVLTDAERVRWARVRTVITATLFVGFFFATRYTQVPFESTRLDLFDEVLAHWSAFWSNNFAFDQDVLSWKMYWGVFGYADVFYPPAIYALARWFCVGFFLALPVLSVRFTSKRPVASAQLLLVSGFALSVCIVTNGIRHLQPALPWGRFILPLLPLAALPALARTDAPGRERVWRAVTFAAVALHLWTALTLLGSRYAVGN